jgi:arylsulfatase A-like enzyme
MKNIILIITDTFRYDNLSDKAKRPIKTPELDKFAAEKATSIEKFYTGSFPTIPHRTDLASSILGWPHFGWQPIDRTVSNHIAVLLRQCGYATQLICDTTHLFNARFHRGFDAAFRHRGQEGDKHLLHLNDQIEKVMPYEKTRLDNWFRGHPLVDQHRWINRYFRYEAETFAARTAATAIRWLEENWKASPFFLWVDFFDPHEPWDPPEYLVRRYDPEYGGVPMIHPNYGHSTDYTPEELENLWAHYAAESELVDRYIGRILQKIDDLQLWEETIVVVTSDHGTSIGEHERTGKSNINRRDGRFWPLYPEISHVPFLIGGGDIEGGKTLDLIAQPIDILPTLCDLTEVQVKPIQSFHGRSFAKALLNGEPSHRKYAVSGQHIAGNVVPRKATTPFLITERWGYAPVGADGKPELYDLTRDPLAENDVSGDNPDVIRETHDLFLEHLRLYGATENFLSLWRRP